MYGLRVITHELLGFFHRLRCSCLKQSLGFDLYLHFAQKMRMSQIVSLRSVSGRYLTNRRIVCILYTINYQIFIVKMGNKMPTLSKKWLLAMLFCAMPFLATQQPESAIAGSVRSETATKKPSRLKAGLRYVLDTVKSDLSIGNKVVQHESVSSQLAAAGRLCGYHFLITMLMILLHYKLHYPQFSDTSPVAALANSHMGTLALMGLYIGAIGPIIEETLFTYIPKVIGDKLSLKMHNAILLVTATMFGCIHTYKSAPLMISIGCMNYMHGRYLLGRNPTNAVPKYTHMMWNSALFAAAVAAMKCNMNT